MTSSVLLPLLLSLKVASITTLLIVPLGALAGLLLARRRFTGRSAVETLLALPLVLPPTAVGYLLLRLLARDGPFGVKNLRFDPDLLLTWKGAVLAAAVMSLPLVARTARVAFEEVDPRLETMARTLGLSPLRTFFEITLPLARRGLLAAALLGFARALGEFGATVVVAGNIPGRTQTLALAIFSDIQSGDDRRALWLVGLTVALAFAVVYAVEALLRRRTPPA
ncbi:MAG TPA: molybdate ABC transporter permease subunit [Candidatus Polarisedimenticolia bacterium]|nr:molybdate ABC transporter permease subunit [Candidatus Polarisedimenticolia bacterium]